MSLITNININNIPLFIELFNSSGTRRPNLAFIFVNDDGIGNTKMPVSTDETGGIVTMDRLVPAKSKPHNLISNSYCIGIKFCKYVHYKTNTIISTIEELYERSPEFVNNYVFFAINNQIINDPLSYRDNKDLKMFSRSTMCEIDKTIETFISICPYSIFELGYYIPPENTDYVHIFKKGSTQYVNGVVDYNSIFTSESWNILKQKITSYRYEQTKNIEITHFILFLLMPLFFNQ